VLPLVTALKARGHEVWQCDLHTSAMSPTFEPTYPTIASSNVFEANQYDYVYHLAAEFGAHQRRGVLRHALETTSSARATCSNGRRRKVPVNLRSSSEIYGDRHATVLTEDIPLQQSIIQHNDYATTKWVRSADYEFRASLRQRNCAVPVLNAYGPASTTIITGGGRLPVLLSGDADFAVRSVRRHHRVFMYIDELHPYARVGLRPFVPGEVYNIGGEESDRSAS